MQKSVLRRIEYRSNRWHPMAAIRVLPLALSNSSVIIFVEMNRSIKLSSR